MKKSVDTSRRAFLTKGTVLATGGALVALAGTARAQEHCAPVPGLRYHKIYDVIVVGSGFAGLAAALEAVQAGRSVLVIDKMPVFGGNSAINGGAVAGSPLQQEAGIKDSSELMYKDMLKAGRGLNDKEQLKILVENTTTAYEFTLKHGVKYKPFVQHFGGHSVPRTLQTVESSGAGITRPLKDSAARLGVIFRARCKMESFIQNAQGRVIGLTVRDDYRFPDEQSGQIRHYGARYGVVMCSGGFSNDVRFRKLQNPVLDERVDSTNHPGATAECLVQMLRIGATPVQLDLIQLGPWSSPDERGFGYVSQFSTIAGFPNGIMVNPRTGHRFTNMEGAKLAQSLGHALHYGVAWKFDTLEQLAAHFGIPYATLQEEVDAYNAAVERKGGDRMNKDVSRAISLAKGPYAAVRVWPKVHYVMGGVQISMRAEVLNAADSQPIVGLYAAGEATAGSHGGSRLGSCAVADCLVFGRIAGGSVAAATPVDNSSFLGGA
ncbi:FAD-dependent oxidoreductase [Escherichia albertii]|uniref:FAD-dependent oxidoreductase n=1 Tax=Escherichia albertii TaxID=208962 RepID=UPI0011EE9FC3|nr:FAD-dependent oxidoreductase [Escherichia albertii]